MFYIYILYDCIKYFCYSSLQQRISGTFEPDSNFDINGNYGIWISFAEIYNEMVSDLLVPSDNRQIMKIINNNGCSYIKDLSIISASSAVQVFQLLQFEVDQLKFANTNVNSKSSRSHFIFTIKLTHAIDAIHRYYYRLWWDQQVYSNQLIKLISTLISYTLVKFMSSWYIAPTYPSSVFISPIEMWNLPLLVM